MNNKFYVPEGVPADYKFVVPSNDYYDIYNTDYLNANSTYTYYRFYNNLDQDMYVCLERNTSNYNYGYLNCVEIQPQSSYIYRKDYPQILSSVFILTLGFIVLLNILTSIIKKGGVFSGLL